VVFRCLNVTAIANTDRSKGKISKAGNSGTVGVEVGVGVAEEGAGYVSG